MTITSSSSTAAFSDSSSAIADSAETF